MIRFQIKFLFLHSDCKNLFQEHLIFLILTCFDFLYIVIILNNLIEKEIIHCKIDEDYKIREKKIKPFY